MRILIVLAALTVFLAGMLYFVRKPAVPQLTAVRPEKSEKTILPAREKSQAPASSFSFRQPEETAGSEPAWLKTALALYEKYENQWQKMKPAPETSALEVKVPSSPPPESEVTPAAPAVPEKPAEVVRVPATATPPASAAPVSTVASSPAETPVFSGGSSVRTTPAADSGKESSDAGNDTTTPEQLAPIFITRTIRPFGGGAQVTLNITVGEAISGLIITEQLPEGYAVYSASPNYAKKVGNAYKWLFYGSTISSQQVIYEIRGKGTGSLSGYFNSSRGQGIITGDSKVGG